ncbi:MAG TPA: hypothetical protein VFU32_09990 [Ktedonobacterales bacterium]|nr:hypothetical protein [Ktedonobacterales bacterium]
MLKMGLLWFDDNPKRPLAEKLEEAAERYQERFDRWPTLVHLNPTQAEGLSVKYKRLRVFGDEHLRRNYFIVGVDEVDAGAAVPQNPSTAAEQGHAAVEEAAEPVGVAAGAGLALTAPEAAKPRRSRRQHSAASVSSVVHRRVRRAS